MTTTQSSRYTRLVVILGILGMAAVLISAVLPPNRADADDFSSAIIEEHRENESTYFVAHTLKAKEAVRGVIARLEENGDKEMTENENAVEQESAEKIKNWIDEHVQKSGKRLENHLSNSQKKLEDHIENARKRHERD